MQKLRDNGGTYEQIAEKLERSVKTVRKHLNLAEVTKTQPIAEVVVQPLIQQRLTEHYDDLLKEAKGLIGILHYEGWSGIGPSLVMVCLNEGQIQNWWADDCAQITGDIIQEMIRDKRDLMAECLLEHLSAEQNIKDYTGEQIIRDYKKWQQLRVPLLQNCEQLLVDLCQSIKQECEAVFNELPDPFSRENIEFDFLETIFLCSLGTVLGTTHDIDSKRLKRYEFDHDSLKLHLGDVCLASAGYLETLEQLKRVHETLMQRYASFPLVQEIQNQQDKLTQIADRLIEYLGIVFARRVPPGTCRACPNV